MEPIREERIKLQIWARAATCHFRRWCGPHKKKMNSDVFFAMKWCGKDRKRKGEIKEKFQKLKKKVKNAKPGHFSSFLLRQLLSMPSRRN